MPSPQQTILPASAQDVYYRDEIGNISTSHLQVLDDSVEVEIRPRFPLFGGWKTHYIIGYNLPSYEYLYTLGELISNNTKASCPPSSPVQFIAARFFVAPLLKFQASVALQTSG